MSNFQVSSWRDHLLRGHTPTQKVEIHVLSLDDPSTGVLVIQGLEHTETCQYFQKPSHCPGSINLLSSEGVSCHIPEALQQFSRSTKD